MEGIQAVEGEVARCEILRILADALRDIIVVAQPAHGGVKRPLSICRRPVSDLKLQCRLQGAQLDALDTTLAAH